MKSGYLIWVACLGSNWLCIRCPVITSFLPPPTFPSACYTILYVPTICFGCISMGAETLRGRCTVLCRCALNNFMWSKFSEPSRISFFWDVAPQKAIDQSLTTVVSCRMVTLHAVTHEAQERAPPLRRAISSPTAPRARNGNRWVATATYLLCFHVSGAVYPSSPSHTGGSLYLQSLSSD